MQRLLSLEMDASRRQKIADNQIQQITRDEIIPQEIRYTYYDSG